MYDMIRHMSRFLIRDQLLACLDRARGDENDNAQVLHAVVESVHDTRHVPAAFFRKRSERHVQLAVLAVCCRYCIERDKSTCRKHELTVGGAPYVMSQRKWHRRRCCQPCLVGAKSSAVS